MVPLDGPLKRKPVLIIKAPIVTGFRDADRRQHQGEGNGEGGQDASRMMDSSGAIIARIGFWGIV